MQNEWREPIGCEDHSTAVVGGEQYLWGGGHKVIRAQC